MSFQNLQPDAQLVTLVRARRILGNEYLHLSDDQVKEIIHTLHLLAREQLHQNGSNDKILVNEQFSADEYS